MSDLTEYEDFLPNVRESLYRKSQSGMKSNGDMYRKSKKVKFNSTDKSELLGPRSEKLKSRKGTPFKRKLTKKPIRGEVVASPHRVNDEHKHKKKKSKKQVAVSVSNSNESFDEELGDIQLTPSKSELETFQNAIHTSKRKLSDIIGSSSEDDENESANHFDLETFFNTREIGELNESVTEAHSGIDYEFVSDYAKDVKIMESEPLCNPKETVDTESDNVGESDEDMSQDNVPQPSTENKIELITNKIQEAVVIDNDDWKETSRETSFESDQLLQEEEPVKEIVILEETKKFGEVETSNYCSAQYHEFDNKKIVILYEKQTIAFHGLCMLKVLHGKIEVLGNILDSNSSAVNLYSPRGSALLYIQNLTNCEDSDRLINIRQLLSTENGVNDIFIEANCAAVICSKLEDTKVSFLERYVAQKLFPRLENDNMPQVIFEPSGSLNTIKQSSVWDEVLTNVSRDTKLMITGGKGVGKSTLLRFAINRLLNTFDKVRVLDLDPGQSEFTVPGCISVVTVTEPVFGPNFTHLKQSNRSLLCHINVAHDPKAYLNCIKSIIAYLDTLEGEYPILINYMGFVHGIGLNIVSSAIKYIQPTIIVQVCSKSHKKNFMHDLTYQFVVENSMLFSVDDKSHLDYSDLNYKMYKIPAMNDECDGWTLDARQSREMYVLAYFGQMMRDGVNSLTSHHLPIYEINLSEVKITNLQREEIDPAMANANLVALCSLEQKSVFRCLGYGVVRGIDLEQNKLILITPEEIKDLEDVYYLVMGSVFLPPAVYMTPDDVAGTIPYVMEGELLSLGQITKRSYLPANKK